MKKEPLAIEKPKRAYEKPVLTRHQNLKLIIAGTEETSPDILGCARAY